MIRVYGEGLGYLVFEYSNIAVTYVDTCIEGIYDIREKICVSKISCSYKLCFYCCSGSLRKLSIVLFEIVNLNK